MNPIYKEYCEFLKDKTGLELQEGMLWLDRQIIKCFDREGKTHKLYRICVDDNLNVTYKKSKGYENIEDIDCVDWLELVELHKEHLEDIERDSLDFIAKIVKENNEYYPQILTSGGKDSSVVMYLVRKILPKAHAIFNNTSLDCADTYKHIKTIDNCQTISPKEGFYQWRERINFVPTRFARACCSIFKENSTIITLPHNEKYMFFLGMRNEESNTRVNYTDLWRNCKWADNWLGCLPIRKWAEIDIWLYIFKENIATNPKYRKGYSRAGCSIACPYAVKSVWVLDKYFYPQMRDRWENILRKHFITDNKWLVMNCTINEFVMSAWNGGVYRSEPTQEVINEFAKYNGINADVAAKYFNKACSDCGAKIRDKEVLSMNMKFHGREITKFMCKKCFKKLYDMDDTVWNRYVEDFKRDGCALFDAVEDK